MDEVFWSRFPSDGFLTAVKEYPSRIRTTSSAQKNLERRPWYFPPVFRRRSLEPAVHPSSRPMSHNSPFLGCSLGNISLDFDNQRVLLLECSRTPFNGTVDALACQQPVARRRHFHPLPLVDYLGGPAARGSHLYGRTMGRVFSPIPPNTVPPPNSTSASGAAIFGAHGSTRI